MEESLGTRRERETERERIQSWSVGGHGWGRSNTFTEVQDDDDKGWYEECFF